MNFQNLGKIEPYMFYLDVAFKSAKTKGDLTRQKRLGKDKLKRSKAIEREKITAITKSLVRKLSRILNAFPYVDELHPFYQELVKCTLDYDALKKSLGAVNWVVKKVEEFSNKTINNIKRTQDIRKINSYRREFYGRVSSLIKQIRKDFVNLDEARKVMKEYPIIKTSLFTVAITGFPNIGKTTLLYKLTGSKPEINSYAFTTKRINVGYFQEDNKKIQVLDTPGTFNRFDKMNNIEKQAFLAMKYCSNFIIYVFDLTEPYSLEEQIKLYEKIKDIGKSVIIYLSKTDILDREIIHKFKIKEKAIFKTIPDLKKSILLASS